MGGGNTGTVAADGTEMGGGNTGTVAAGIAVGVLVVLALLVCICLALVMLRRRRTSLRKEVPDPAITENEAISYPNAVYGGPHGTYVAYTATFMRYEQNWLLYYDCIVRL